MEIPLSPQQRDAINAHPGEPLPMVDLVSSEKYFLVPAPAFLHLQGLAEEDDQRCHDQLQHLIQEGIDSRTVSADEAFSRLRRTAQRLVDESK